MPGFQTTSLKCLLMTILVTDTLPKKLIGKFRYNNNSFLKRQLTSGLFIMSNYHNLLASADRIKKLAESFLQDFDWRVFFSLKDPTGFCSNIFQETA